MRIVFISHSSPLKEGGAETRTREVAFRLARAGHQVSILCGRTNISDPDMTEVEGVRIFAKKILPDLLLKRFPYPHYFSLAAANLFLMFHVFPFLRRERPDVIREDVAPFPPTFLVSLLRLKVKERIAVVHMMPRTLSGWTKFYGSVFGFAGFLMNRLLRTGKLRYDRIVSDSRWFAEELKEYDAISNKVSYVPNGVNLEHFKCDRQHRNGNRQIRLLSVGRLAETKGHRYAIEALLHLKTHYPDVKLEIIGNGPLKGPLMRRARELGVDHMVEILPPISHVEMLKLYNEYDFFVMPSVWEGLPVALIEAMASKLPVIATNIKAITDVLDEGSATFALSEDAGDLATKMKWAFEHPDEVRQYARSAYDIVKKYDWADTTRGEITGYLDAR